MSDQRSDSDQWKRDIPSFIESRPPLILNPFMRPRPKQGINLMDRFNEDSEIEESELVQVYLRLKPCRSQTNMYEVKSDRCLITSVDTATAGHGRRTQHNVSKMYTFSHIFGPESSQKEIFEHVVKENLRKLPDGHNFTLLTYGASGSGKTYTLMGTVPSPGLVPRSLEYVFRVVDAAQHPVYKPAEGGADKLDLHEQDYELQWVKILRNVSAPLRDKYRRMSVQLRNDLTGSTLELANRTRYYVWVSFVEIYNEAIYDLLTSNDRSKSSSKLRIREDANGHAYVKGATQAFVRSGEEAYDVMAAGKHNLQVAATGVHAQSSRSHCIFTITMLTETEDGVRSSCVRLCDLAGCERARQTRNTGARMQESRAINSSLHVLERCLHMLRRKQKQKGDSTLVPYRESKLTRLLGAGLSGMRGEAVAMVVTLNPAPEFSHETRHVLQLAAVARDIQVNSTVAESTLDTVSQETTVDCSFEMMRLRADNERLRYELAQAGACIRQLKKSMEDEREDAAKTMQEFMEEVRDIERKYCKDQLEILKTEMQDMKEEYENEIRALRSSNSTPPRYYKMKIAELEAENAILHETLSQERLAHARVEEEMQHLRACIEERDAKSEADSCTEHCATIVLSDSESEEFDDPANESLEPTFKRQNLNKTRLLQQSTCDDSESLIDERDATVEETGHDATVQDNVDESVLEKSRDTVKDIEDEQNESTKYSISCNDESETTGVNETSEGCKEELNKTNSDNNRNNDDNDNGHKNCTESELKGDSEDRGTCFFRDNKDFDKLDSKERGTYFVRDGEDVDKADHEASINRVKTPVRLLRGTYFVTALKDTSNDDNYEQGCIKTNIDWKDYPVVVKSPVDVAKEIPNKKSDEVLDKSVATSIKSSHENDLSLAQFEQLEKDAKYEDPKNTIKTFTDFCLLKEMKYFDDPELETDKDLIKVKVDKKTYFDNIDVNINVSKAVTKIDNLKLINDDRSPSIVKDEVGNNFEPNKALKLMGESFTRQPDIISSTNTTYDVSLPKKHLSVDIFEGFDSPNILCKAVEKGNLVKTKSQNNISQAVIKKEAAEEAVPTKFEKSNHAAESNTKIDSQTEYIVKEDLNIKLEVLESEKRQPINKFELPCANSEKPLESNVSMSILSHTKVKDVVETDPKNAKSLVSYHKRDDKIKPNNEMEVKEKEVKEKEVLETFAKPLSVSNLDETRSDYQTSNDTANAFENIFKDVSAPRATEFELLVSQEISSGNLNQTNVDKTIDSAPSNDNSTTYNLRHRDTSTVGQKKTEGKRNLRLRRRKNHIDDDKSEGSNDECNKLKDVVNLQKEYSDLTMDMPVVKKQVKDIPSPETVAGEEENLPPLYGVQSCPSKSVTRSRRKLFTPRPEPPEEPLVGTEDSNERVCVPRPSYHRTRVRRKL